MWPSFNNGFSLYDEFTPAPRQLSEQMVRWWGGFARFGAPLARGQPHWPSYQRGASGTRFGAIGGGSRARGSRARRGSPHLRRARQSSCSGRLTPKGPSTPTWASASARWAWRRWWSTPAPASRRGSCPTSLARTSPRWRAPPARHSPRDPGAGRVRRVLDRRRGHARCRWGSPSSWSPPWRRESAPLHRSHRRDAHELGGRHRRRELGERADHVQRRGRDRRDGAETAMTENMKRFKRSPPGRRRDEPVRPQARRPAPGLTRRLPRTAAATGLFGAQNPC
jgi:hypothetical protein